MKRLTSKLERVLLFVVIIALIVGGAAFFKKYTSPKTGPDVKKPDSSSPSVYTLPNGFTPELQKGPYTCPLGPGNCNGVTFAKDGSMVASGSAGVVVYAAFNGRADVLSSTHFLENGRKEDYTTIILTNEERGLVARYELKGRLIEPTAVVGKVPGVTEPYMAPAVQEGDRLTVTTGQLGFAKGSVKFTLSHMTKNGLSIVPLSVKEFK